MQRSPSFYSRDRPVAMLAGALVAFLHPLLYGYTWGGGDQDDLIPPILARINPSLFANDAYVQGQLEGGFTVRAAYQAILTAFSRFISTEAAVGFLHVLTLAGVGFMVVSLGRAMGARRSASLLAAILACLVLPWFTLGGNHLVYSMLTPEGMAWVGALAATTIFLRKHAFIAAIVLGVTWWLHALVGALTLAVLAALAAYEVYKEIQEKPKRTAAQEADYQMDYVMGRGRQKRMPWKGWPPTMFIAGTLLIALPVVGPAIMRQSASGGSFPEGLDAFTLYAVLRHPHHLLPGAFGALEWVLFLAFVALGVAGYVLASRQRRAINIELPLMLGGIFLGLAIGATYVIYELESLTIARLQVFKLTVLLNVVLCIGIASGALSVLQKDTRRKLDDVLRSKAPFYVAAAVLLFLAARDVRSPDTYSTRGVTAWAREQTDTGAIFLVPPSMDTFRVPSRRAVVTTWKSVPFTPSLGASWWSRLSDIAPLSAVPERGRGLVEVMDRSYAGNSDSRWRALAEKYNADYAVVPAGTESALPVAHTSGDWSVLDLR